MQATVPMMRKTFFKFRMKGRSFVLNSFKYTPSTSWFGLSTTGQVSVYDQGGFTMTFGSTAAEFAAQISQLYQGYVGKLRAEVQRMRDYLDFGFNVVPELFLSISRFTMQT